MRKVWSAIILSFFIGICLSPSRAQVKVNLVDCPDCIYIANADSIFYWLPQSISSLDPRGAFGNTYESMAIGHVKHKEDTVLNTYIIQDFENQDFKYWDGRYWKALFMPPIDNKVIGFGGYGAHLYLLVNYRIGDSRIYYYNGHSMKLILSDPNTVGADIAVDSLGRAWYATGTPMTVVNHLNVIDTTGTILKRFPLDRTFGARNLYGMAIVRDSIYIGLGPDAPTLPSSILSLEVKGDSAFVKRVIPQAHAAVYYQDLASYKPGIPDRKTKQEDTGSKAFDISIFPNPSTGILNIDSDISGKINLELYDIRGRLLYSQILTAGETTDISQFAKAAYMYRIIIGDKINTGLVVKH